MDNAAAYLIMILSPVFWLIMKLSVQYAMVYENPKKKLSRSFLRKNSGGFWASFFSWNIRDRVGCFRFYFHIVLSVIVLLGVFQMITYSVLAMIGHALQTEMPVWITVYLDIALSLIRTGMIFRAKIK